MSVKFQGTIAPIPVPDNVKVQFGSDQWVDVELKHLNEEQLAGLVDEFAQRLFERAGKKLET